MFGWYWPFGVLGSGVEMIASEAAECLTAPQTAEPMTLQVSAIKVRSENEHILDFKGVVAALEAERSSNTSRISTMGAEEQKQEGKGSRRSGI